MEKDLNNLLYINLIIIVLLLSMFNLRSPYKREAKVLGVNVINDNKAFWEELVSKNPTYRDGWLELGRMDKVSEIDPNFKSN